MTQRRPQIVIADTSVLVNFLHVDRMALLGGLACEIVITEHVEAEVTEFYAEQVARLADAMARGHVGKTQLTTEPEVMLFGQLMSDGRLGSGECAAIACAIKGGHALAIDDKKAAREALRIEQALTVLGTADLMLQAIREGLLTVAEADAIKLAWEQHHRFKMTFASFAELL